VGSFDLPGLSRIHLQNLVLSLGYFSRALLQNLKNCQEKGGEQEKRRIGKFSISYSH
jgi:hypothetical protein